MEIKDLLMLKKINFGILTLTVGLVLVFGLSVVAGIMGSNPYKEIPHQAASGGVMLEEAEVSASADETSTDGRSPASIVAAAVGTGAATIDFTCIEKKEQHTLKVQSAQMRIRAKLCGDFDVAKTEIINTSNGYTAIVFKTGDRVMSSDYIQLSNGMNHIKIQLQDRHGSLKTSELLVSRSQEF